MTDSAVNQLDPVLDDAYPRIGPADLSLPTAPDHDHDPEQGDQPEPEQTEDEL
jgi:hypothetical protein